MTEPKTIADAKRLTLRKIKECMELPIGERGTFWHKHTWDYDNRRRYCAFCLIVQYTHGACDCIAIEECIWFKKYVLGKWRREDLRTLYRMVKEIEV